MQLALYGPSDSQVPKPSEPGAPDTGGPPRSVQDRPSSTASTVRGHVNFSAGTALVCGGDPEAGLALLERAMALGPLDPGYFMFLTVAGTAHRFSGRPAKALELAQRSAALDAGWDTAYWALTPT